MSPAVLNVDILLMQGLGCICQSTKSFAITAGVGFYKEYVIIQTIPPKHELTSSCQAVNRFLLEVACLKIVCWFIVLDFPCLVRFFYIRQPLLCHFNYLEETSVIFSNCFKHVDGLGHPRAKQNGLGPIVFNVDFTVLTYNLTIW